MCKNKKTWEAVVFTSYVHMLNSFTHSSSTSRSLVDICEHVCGIVYLVMTLTGPWWQYDWWCTNINNWSNPLWKIYKHLFIFISRCLANRWTDKHKGCLMVGVRLVEVLCCGSAHHLCIYIVMNPKEETVSNVWL